MAYWFIWRAENDRWRDKKTFHLLIPLQFPISAGLFQAQTRSQKLSPGLFLWVQRPKYWSHHSLLSRTNMSRKLASDAELGFKPGRSEMGCSILNGILTSEADIALSLSCSSLSCSSFFISRTNTFWSCLFIYLDDSLLKSDFSFFPIFNFIDLKGHFHSFPFMMFIIRSEISLMQKLILSFNKEKFVNS